MKQKLHLLRLGLLLMVATAVTLSFLIRSGQFDPRPIGQPIRQYEPSTQTIAATHGTIQWLPDRLPAADFTVRTNFTHLQGELESAYGFALADGSDHTLVIALSPLGNATIFAEEETVLAWQPWPHIRQGTAVNELWLTVNNGTLAVRINRELLWTGPLGRQPTQLGIYGQTSGRQTTFATGTTELFTIPGQSSSESDPLPNRTH